MRASSLLIRYAAGLAFAYLLTATEVVAIVISVSNEAVIGAQAVLGLKNLVAIVAIIVLGTLSVWLGGVALVKQRKAPNITKRQSAILLAPWVVTAVVM